MPSHHPRLGPFVEKPKTGSMWRGHLATEAARESSKVMETAFTPVPDFRKFGSRVAGNEMNIFVMLRRPDLVGGTRTKVTHYSRGPSLMVWLGKGVTPDNIKGKRFGVITLDYITTTLASL